MPRFFVSKDSISGNIITVTGADAAHIGYSLRMKQGDDITFCREGTEYFCRIKKITSDSVICEINSSAPTDCEPDIKLTIFQALPKSDKFELIIQKTVELGVYRIVPFISSRCVSRPDREQSAKKLRRFRKIAEEAAKQSGRGIIPDIADIISFDEMLEDRSADIRIICSESGGENISVCGFEKGKDVSVIIGPEGGFEQTEIAKAVSQGNIPVWLGKRILRCETCPIAVTAVIMNLTGNM